jgi:predicted CXXCH cytochrome family protein
LFRDFRVDLTNAALERLNPADRHVQENVRDVVLLGQDRVTCLSCHDVHGSSSQKHQLLADSNICRNCHADGTNKLIRYEVHSQICGY